MPDRIHGTNIDPALPAPITDGLPVGYFKAGTVVTKRWATGIQESVIRPLEDGSITPDQNDYDQFAVLLTGIHAIASEIRTTLSTVAHSTVAKRIAIAVTNAIVAADHAIVMASQGSINGGARSILLGDNVENANDDRMVWGHGATAITKTSGNQNVKGFLEFLTGRLYTTGNLETTAKVKASKGITLAADSNTAVWYSAHIWDADFESKVGGRLIVPFTASHPFTPATSELIKVRCLTVDEDLSHVLPSIKAPTGRGAFTCTWYPYYASGTDMGFWVRLDYDGADTVGNFETDLTVFFQVINPVVDGAI